MPPKDPIKNKSKTLGVEELEHTKAEDYFGIYSNYVQAASTNHDISLQLCELIHPTAKPGEAKPIVLHKGYVAMSPDQAVATAALLFERAIIHLEIHGTLSQVETLGKYLSLVNKQFSELEKSKLSQKP